MFEQQYKESNSTQKQQYRSWNVTIAIATTSKGSEHKQNQKDKSS